MADSTPDDLRVRADWLEGMWSHKKDQQLLRWAADRIEEQAAELVKWKFMALEGSALTEREAVALYDDVIESQARIEELEAGKQPSAHPTRRTGGLMSADPTPNDTDRDFWSFTAVATAHLRRGIAGPPEQEWAADRIEELEAELAEFTRVTVGAHDWAIYDDEEPFEHGLEGLTPGPTLYRRRRTRP